MQNRHIREVIKPQAMWPTDKGTTPSERRTEGRFRCRLPAVLSKDGIDFPIECHEVSFNGLRISTKSPIRLSSRQQVRVKLRIGAQTFADTFVVVRVSKSNQGTYSLHLRLEDDPAVVAHAGKSSFPAEATDQV